MKLTIGTKILDAALQHVLPLATGKTTLPVLSCVCITAEKGGTVRLTCNDLDTSFCREMMADIKASGGVAVNASLLAACVSKFTGEDTELSVDAKFVVTVKSGKYKSTLHGLPPAEFPTTVSMTEECTEFEVPGKEFGLGLKQGAMYVSDDTTRVVINGVALVQNEGNLCLVATDGRRLIAVQYEVEVPAGLEAIVCTAAVRLLMGALDGPAVPVSVKVGESCVSASWPGAEFMTKRIAGNYPNWRQVVPAAERVTKQIVLPRAETLQALSFAAVTVTAKAHSVKLDASKDATWIKSTSPDIGESEVEISGHAKNAKLSIAFNPKFLRELILLCTTPDITFMVEDEMSPALVRDGNKTLVVMPIRLV